MEGLYYNMSNSSFNYTPYIPCANHPVTYVPYTLHAYVLPIYIIVGIIGNSISIVIFSGQFLNKVSSSVYVRAVLGGDLGLLLTMTFVWLGFLGYEANHVDGLCQFSAYFSYVCSFISAWYIVCITVENYITICHPTQIARFCTVIRAKIVTASLGISALVFYSLTLFITQVEDGPNGTMCKPKDEYVWWQTYLTYADTLVTMLIPITAITLIMILISVRVLAQIRKKKRMSTDSRRFRVSQMPQVRVAKMMFVLSLTFLLLNLPMHVFKVRFLFLTLADIKIAPDCDDSLMNYIFVFLSYGNVSVKFFLLFTFCENFRKPILKLQIFKLICKEEKTPAKNGATTSLL